MKNDIYHIFNDFLSDNLENPKQLRYLIAVSAGLDSVVLANLCKRANLNFGIAHCNFNLRQAESDEDARFVKRLAKELNVPFHTTSFETVSYAEDHKVSIQVAARELRYKWFAQVLDDEGFDVLCTGHHLNDSAETFFINLSRGTGLEGLTGIPNYTDHVLRPLLDVSREDIMDYAKSHNIEWREDSSNSSDKYLRNAIRHTLIPKLKELNHKFLENYSTTQRHLKQTSALIEDYTRLLMNDIVQERPDGYELSITKLNKYSNTEAVLYQLLKDFGFTEWDNINHLLDAQTGKQVFSSSHRLIKDRDCLLLVSNTSIQLPTKKIFETDTKVSYYIGHMKLQRVDMISEIDANILYLDADLITFPLILRPWKDGDSFKPFGMKGHKKLSDFFRDEKLSLLQKEQSFVLESGGDIVWVVGQRGDDRFKITRNTKDIIKIIWQA